MRELGIIALKEFGDRFRSGWVVACALVWLGAIGLTSLFGLVQIGKIGVQGYERTVVSLLNVVQYLVPLLALLLGHDLLASEREEKTLALVLAGGVSRVRLLLGKFLGGCLTLGFPLTLGFTIAGTVIGLAANADGLGPFFKLAFSGLILGIVFLALGLLLSTFCRTRIQALVLALLAWCAAVFAFDLAAMGLLVITRTPQAAREVEAATDPMHVNAIADVHAAFENGDDAAARLHATAPRPITAWLLVNPVDLFRAINLPRDLAPALPPAGILGSIVLWLMGCLSLGNWKLKRLDL